MKEGNLVAVIVEEALVTLQLFYKVSAFLEGLHNQHLLFIKTNNLQF